MCMFTGKIIKTALMKKRPNDLEEKPFKLRYINGD